MSLRMLAALLVVLVGCAPVMAQPDQHLRLLTEVSGDRIRVLSAVRVEGAPRASVPPRRKTRLDLRPGVVASILNDAGEQIALVPAQNARPVADRGAARGHPIAGGRPAGPELRWMTIPIPSDASSLALYQVRSIAGEPESAETVFLAEAADDPRGLQALALLPLTTDAPVPRPRSPLPFAPEAIPENVRLSVWGDEEGTFGSWEATTLPEPDPDAPLEAILDLERTVPQPGGFLHEDSHHLFFGDADEIDTRFDILIFAEGYTEDEFDEFELSATDLAAEIINTEPFSDLQDRLNIWMIRTVSNDSGVYLCSTGDEVETYFHSQGEWPTEAGTWAGLMGTPYPELLVGAGAECGIPFAQADLYVVLANCDQVGGVAWPGLYTAFVARPPCDRTFLHNGIHEMAHVIAPLGDEYSSLDVAPHEFSNLVHQDDVADDMVWWSDLLKESEVDEESETGFRYVADCNSPWTTDMSASSLDCNPCPPCSPAIDMPHDAIGLVWVQADSVANSTCTFCVECEGTAGAVECEGCAEDGGCCADCPDTETVGCEFFRPAGWCKMRYWDYDFCRVCAAELTHYITGGDGS